MSRERILVVDDEFLIRWSLQEDLGKEGYDVLTAEDGRESIEIMEKETPDLVLLDIHLPEIDGIKVLERMKEIDREVPVIMITAYGMVESAVAAMRLGAYDYINKPFNLDDVKISIRKALETTRLKSEVARLRREQHKSSGFDNIIGDSPKMKEVFEMVRKVAVSSATTVLLQGESGTGKDLIAKAVHFTSERADKPFMDINCASLPEQLLESELFGHEKGAFTDARGAKKGLFELADGGSILLDEIAEMRTDLQAKLLRVIEEKKFRRLGGVKNIFMDVRIIAASNRDLEEERKKGNFRDDLYYRLKVVPIFLPPLRERGEDILPLVKFYIDRYNKEFGKKIQEITPETEDALREYKWPGNVRELKNVIERAVLLESGNRITIDDLPPDFKATKGSGTPAEPVPLETDAVMPLDQIEKEMLKRALSRTDGNQTKAAELLGVSRDAIRYKMKKHGLL